MNRRGFIGSLTKAVGLVAAVAVLDPEKLLWTPGAKTISIPSGKELQQYSYMMATGPHGNIPKPEYEQLYYDNINSWTYDEDTKVWRKKTSIELAEGPGYMLNPWHNVALAT